MAEEEAEPEPAPVEGPRRTSRSTAAVVAWVLAGVFALTTVLLAVVAVGLKADQDAEDQDRQDVADLASRFVQAFVDYDADDVATLRDDVLPLSAEPFTGQFEDGVEQIHAVNESLGRSSRATIQEVFVASVEGDEATVIVVYDSVETFRELDPVPYQNVYLRLGLVRLGGDWRVNDVLNLNFALSDTGGSVQPPSATTSTTIPSG